MEQPTVAGKLEIFPKTYHVKNQTILISIFVSFMHVKNYIKLLWSIKDERQFWSVFIHYARQQHHEKCGLKIRLVVRKRWWWSTLFIFIFFIFLACFSTAFQRLNSNGDPLIFVFHSFAKKSSGKSILLAQPFCAICLYEKSSADPNACIFCLFLYLSTIRTTTGSLHCGYIVTARAHNVLLQSSQ